MRDNCNVKLCSYTAAKFNHPCLSPYIHLRGHSLLLCERPKDWDALHTLQCSPLPCTLNRAPSEHQ